MPTRGHPAFKRKRGSHKHKSRKRPKWMTDVIRHSEQEHVRYKLRAIRLHSHLKRAHPDRHSTISMDASSLERGRVHEARLIPGVDGVKTWGFPNSIVTKLRYATFNFMQPAIGAVGGQTFAANGLFDPDISGVGHQPMYFDDYARIYDQYVVIGSKISVTFYPRTSAAGWYVGIVGDDDSTVSSTLETLFEQNNSVSTITGSLGSDPTTLTMTFEPQEDFGVDAKSDGFSQTSVTANPTELWVWRLFGSPCDQTVSLVCDYKVEIEYTCKFAELKTPVQN